MMAKNGRSKWIRTTGLCVPNAALYQAELYSDCCRLIALLWGARKGSSNNRGYS